MDKLDYRILSELSKDASLSFVEIAKRLDSTPYTVRRRFEKLKKDGIIRTCIVSINLKRLGYQGKVFLLINVTSKGNKTETLSYLRKVRNIMVVSELIGPYDILAIAPISDLNDLRTLVANVRKAPHVQRVGTAFIEDANFPICPNFGAVISQKATSLADKGYVQA